MRKINGSLDLTICSPAAAGGSSCLFERIVAATANFCSITATAHHQKWPSMPWWLALSISSVGKFRARGLPSLPIVPSIGYLLRLNGCYWNHCYSFTCLGGILGASIERVAKTEAHTQKTILVTLLLQPENNIVTLPIKLLSSSAEEEDKSK